MRNGSASDMLVAALLLGCVASGGRAGDVIWNGPSGGDFNTGANWTPAAVPGPDDTAVFTNLSASQSISLSAGVTNAGVRFGGLIPQWTPNLGTGPYRWYVTNDFLVATDTNNTGVPSLNSGTLVITNAAGTAQLRRAGVPFGEEQVFDSGWTIPDGLATFNEVRETVRDVDSVLCSNDLCALGVIEAADRAGLRVGQDLGVIGIDNLPVSDVSRVSLTSICQPDAALAELATRELVAAIEEDRAVSVRKKLKPELIVRNSTRKTHAGRADVREVQSA